MTTNRAERKPAELFSPGEHIQDELDARGWTQVELAEIMGRLPSEINALILGKRSISPDIAKELAAAFGTSAEFWWNLECTYRIWKSGVGDTTPVSRRARLYELAPIREMVKRRWIEPSENLSVMEQSVKQYLGMKNLDDEPVVLPHAARKPTVNISPSQRAWLIRAIQLAHLLPAQPYSVQALGHMTDKLRSLMLGAPEVRHIPRVLAEGGIRFLVIEQLPQTKIDGATFWLNGKWPVIVLSLRYDRIDYLWYTVAHEIGHVKHGDGLQIDTDIAEWGESHADIPVEKKADDFATNLLVDQSELNSFINRTRPYYQRDLILGFARRIGVHPGIVVGQLQHRGEVSWNHFRKMLVNVRDSIMETALTDGWGHFPSISA